MTACGIIVCNFTGRIPIMFINPGIKTLKVIVKTIILKVDCFALG